MGPGSSLLLGFLGLIIYGLQLTCAQDGICADKPYGCMLCDKAQAERFFLCVPSYVGDLAEPIAVPRTVPEGTICIQDRCDIQIILDSNIEIPDGRGSNDTVLNSLAASQAPSKNYSLPGSTDSSPIPSQNQLPAGATTTQPNTSAGNVRNFKAASIPDQSETSTSSTSSAAPTSTPMGHLDTSIEFKPRPFSHQSANISIIDLMNLTDSTQKDDVGLGPYWFGFSSQGVYENNDIIQENLEAANGDRQNYPNSQNPAKYSPQGEQWETDPWDHRTGKNASDTKSTIDHLSATLTPPTSSSTTSTLTSFPADVKSFSLVFIAEHSTHPTSLSSTTKATVTPGPFNEEQQSFPKASGHTSHSAQSSNYQGNLKSSHYSKKADRSLKGNQGPDNSAISPKFGPASSNATSANGWTKKYHNASVHAEKKEVGLLPVSPETKNQKEVNPSYISNLLSMLVHFPEMAPGILDLLSHALPSSEKNTSKSSHPEVTDTAQREQDPDKTFQKVHSGLSTVGYSPSSSAAATIRTRPAPINPRTLQRASSTNSFESQPSTSTGTTVGITSTSEFSPSSETTSVTVTPGITFKKSEIEGRKGYNIVAEEPVYVKTAIKSHENTVPSAQDVQIKVGESVTDRKPPQSPGLGSVGDILKRILETRQTTTVGTVKTSTSIYINQTQSTSEPAVPDSVLGDDSGKAKIKALVQQKLPVRSEVTDDNVAKEQKVGSAYADTTYLFTTLKPEVSTPAADRTSPFVSSEGEMFEDLEIGLVSIDSEQGGNTKDTELSTLTSKNELPRSSISSQSSPTNNSSRIDPKEYTGSSSSAVEPLLSNDLRRPIFRLPRRRYLKPRVPSAPPKLVRRPLRKSLENTRRLILRPQRSNARTRERPYFIKKGSSIKIRKLPAKVVVRKLPRAPIGLRKNAPKTAHKETAASIASYAGRTCEKRYAGCQFCHPDLQSFFICEPGRRAPTIAKCPGSLVCRTVSDCGIKCTFPSDASSNNRVEKSGADMSGYKAARLSAPGASPSFQPPSKTRRSPKPPSSYSPSSPSNSRYQPSSYAPYDYSNPRYAYMDYYYGNYDYGYDPRNALTSLRLVPQPPPPPTPSPVQSRTRQVTKQEVREPVHQSVPVQHVPRQASVREESRQAYRHDSRQAARQEVPRSTGRRQKSSHKQTRHSMSFTDFSPVKRNTRKMKYGSNCRLPECFPALAGIPGGLDRSRTPMLVFFSFDDAVTSSTYGYLSKLFSSTRKNPNGCPITATHFNSHENTDYSLVRSLYKAGHEIASHSISHRTPPGWWKEASIKQLKDEIVGQRRNIHEKAGVPLSEIRGMRSPFLQLGGERQFSMLEQEGFTYDSSMTSAVDPPTWPFTLQNPVGNIDPQLCKTQPCPKRSYPTWEVPLNILKGNSIHTPQCTMVDACRPNNKEEALKFLRDNFRKYYNAPNKPPFGLNMHAAWFAYAYNLEAMDEFIGELVANEDVWIVPIYKVIQWIENPTPVDRLYSFAPFSC